VTLHLSHEVNARLSEHLAAAAPAVAASAA
jgi:hypothetical protein